MIKIREEFFDHAYGGHDKPFSIYKNPTISDIKELLKDDKDNLGMRDDLRGIVRPNDDLYVWHTDGDMHLNMAEFLRIKPEGCWFLVIHLDKNTKEARRINAKYMMGGTMGREVDIYTLKNVLGSNKHIKAIARDGMTFGLGI